MRELHLRFHRSLSFAALLGLCACADPVAEDSPRSFLHFTDVTADSGIRLTVTSGEDPPSQLLEMKGTGVSLIDFDADGDLDVFAPNGATLGRPNQGPGCRLFENLGGLRFADATAKAGLSFSRWAYAASVADYDGDGFDDIYITCYGRNALLRNDGTGGFVDVSAEAGIEGDSWSTGCAFGDIDGDGDLDLYVANYVRFNARRPPPPTKFLGATVYAGPVGLPALPDFLYENLGDGTFANISESSGIRAVPPAWGLGAIILDLDGDQRQDIYVGNDVGASYLFLNRGDNEFEEAGVASGIGLNGDGSPQATMGIAVGDVDGNGTPDLFTTNFMYDTNTLHVNEGGTLFDDRTVRYGLFTDSRPFLSWGTSFYDFDHDADEDLVVFNGHIYAEELCRANNWDYRQVPLLHERDGQRFRRVSDPAIAGEWVASKHCDRSSAFGDLDADGDVDIVVAERNGPLRVLRNDRDGGSWLLVALEDRRPGRDRRGFGSRIEARAGGASQYRWIVSGLSFMASNQPVAHFGFAPEASAVELEVTWPDGHRQVVRDVATKELHTVIRD